MGDTDFHLTTRSRQRFSECEVASSRAFCAAARSPSTQSASSARSALCPPAAGYYGFSSSHSAQLEQVRREPHRPGISLRGCRACDQRMTEGRRYSRSSFRDGESNTINLGVDSPHIAPPAHRALIADPRPTRQLVVIHRRAGPSGEISIGTDRVASRRHAYSNSAEIGVRPGWCGRHSGWRHQARGTRRSGPPWLLAAPARGSRYRPLP